MSGRLATFPRPKRHARTHHKSIEKRSGEDNPIMSAKPCIALIAHDQKKNDMADFARHHQAELWRFRIVATGTTGGRVQDACPGLEVTRLKSGPLGGDQ